MSPSCCLQQGLSAVSTKHSLCLQHALGYIYICEGITVTQCKAALTAAQLTGISLKHHKSRKQTTSRKYASFLGLIKLRGPDETYDEQILAHLPYFDIQLQIVSRLFCKLMKDLCLNLNCNRVHETQYETTGEYCDQKAALGISDSRNLSLE